MNSYELSRSWFDFCFENPEKISPNHTALYFFCIEHCNRLGWKAKFGLPMEMAKEAIGIKNYRTYSKTFNDLIDWGFIILHQKSKNQYSSNIIALAKYTKATTKATTKALDKAIQKHSQKQGQSIVGIDKPNNIEQLNLITIEQEVFSFDEFWNLYPNKTGKKPCQDKYEKLSNADRLKIKNSIKAFVSYKPFKDYNHPNPLTYLNQRRWDDELPDSKPKQPVINFDDGQERFIVRYMGDPKEYRHTQSEIDQKTANNYPIRVKTKI